MELKIDVRSAQLDELLNVMNNIDQRGAHTASDVALCVQALLALGEKVDALTVAVASPVPVQADPPLTDKPVDDAPAPKAKPAKVRRATRQKGLRVGERLENVRLVGVEYAGIRSEIVEPVKPNGEAHADQEAADIEDEDALRARTQFESKRVARTFGIGASRALIKKVAGDGILQIDDVPSWQLLQLLDELRAM